MSWKFGLEKEPHLGGYVVGLTNHGDPNSYSTEVWDWMAFNGIKSVNIDGSTGKISITGPDSKTVQSAREFLELFEESFDIIG